MVPRSLRHQQLLRLFPLSQNTTLRHVSGSTYFRLQFM